MLRVGLTGGIGSGKSLVASVFELLGVPVYNADERARTLMETSPALISSIKSLLGDNAYKPDGTLDRALVAKLVFDDRELLDRLNAIVHPAVADDFLRWSAATTSEHGYVMHEAALTFESGSYRNMDYIIVVWAPEQLRVQRVMQRDEVGESDVRKRMEKQWPDDDKAKRANSVIINDNSAPLLKQVLDLHTLLCALAGAVNSEESLTKNMI